MRKLLLAAGFTLALLSPVVGQIPGNAPSGNYWGNAGATAKPGKWETGSDLLNRWCSSVSGHFPVNNSGTWGCPALGGDATLAGTGVLTLNTVNGNVGAFGSATQCVTLTLNAKGLVTAASAATCTPAASSVTGGFALTKTDDTNVTLTLGGTPATSLLAATSITVGWTGNLSVARGGTAGGVASGTLLDNITGFAGTGVISRTGPGAYAFGNIPSATTLAGSLLATNIVAPGTPAAGLTSIYVDSTSKRLSSKNDAGIVAVDVVPDTGAANNFLTAISGAGAISKAQVAFSNLSGSAACGQLPALTGDVTTSAGTCADTIVANAVTNAKLATMPTNTAKVNATAGSAVPTDFAMPSCSGAANALLWTTNSGFSCNTLATGGTVSKVIIQVFTASGTYTPTAGIQYALIECWGAGGGGGGTAAAAANSMGASGGAGSHSKKTASAATIGASQVVTIGVAGTAGASGNNAGGNGGDTSVGALCIGKGGTGGGGNSGSSVPVPGLGGIAGTGDEVGTGMSGTGGAISAGGLATNFGGHGGSSSVGGGGTISGFGNIAGGAATGHGSGGSGGSSSNPGGANVGGAGTGGYVVITEFTS